MNVNISAKQKKFIIPILILIIISISALFLLKGKSDNKELENPINTPINSISDIKLSIPNMTDTELQEELNRELTQEEYDAFIEFIDAAQQDIIQLEDIKNSDYIECHEDGSITYLDSDGDLIIYDNQVNIPDNIFDMSLGEFIEARENSLIIWC